VSRSPRRIARCKAVRRGGPSTALPPPKSLTRGGIVISGVPRHEGPENYVILEAMAKVIGGRLSRLAPRLGRPAATAPPLTQIGQTLPHDLAQPPPFGFRVSGAIQQPGRYAHLEESSSQ